MCAIDPVAEKVRRTLRVGDEPAGAALSPDGQSLFVANSGSHDLSVVDTKAGREVARVEVGDGPWGVVVVPEPKGKRVASR